MKKLPKSAVVLATSLLLSLGLNAGADSKPVHQDLLDKHKPEKISEHVYVIQGPTGYPNKENQGFMNNPGFIVTDKEVAVIDPGSSAAIGRAVLAHIRKVTDKPITQVFTTHVHGDHWLGNQAFKEENPDVKFFAHPTMIEEATNGAAAEWISTMDTMTEKATAGTEAIIPTEVLVNAQEIKVGDLTLKAHIIEGKVHSATDVMYEVVGEKVLFTGDNINNKRIVRMDDGSFVGSIKAAEHALTLDVDKVVPGHGPTGSKNTLTYYRDYLSKVYSSVKEMRNEMEAHEMKPKIAEKLADYKDWQGLDEELGKHISLSVLEAEQEDF
jgi:glyoxylase-like metal-dependent hydrolase (beta-lactamase superfamily II)